MSTTTDVLMATLVDENSFSCWDTSPKDPEADAEYLAELAAVRRATGCSESVTTGEATIGGQRLALVISEFSFLGGSIGAAAARRVIEAARRATDEGLPLLAMPASGGTRMQEGTSAFVRMTDIARAVHRHKAAGLPYIVYLRHPTMGGVTASWGSLGQLTYAEPQALIGFLGPKVYRALHGSDFPRDVQTAENLFEHGIVDEVVDLPTLRVRLAQLLPILGTRRSGPPPQPQALPDTSAAVPVATDAWAAVGRTRSKDRPGVVELLARVATDAVVVSGTGAGERDDSVVVVLARIGETSCLIVGQDHSRALRPPGLRQAQRGLRLAAAWQLPVVTVVDTPGAELSAEAEEAALAAEIARCIEMMVAHPCPTISLLLGQGTGGGALALVPARRVIALENSWLAPLPPEGASVIKHGCVGRAVELARAQGITAAELVSGGIADRVLPESKEDTFAAVGRALSAELSALCHSPSGPV
ncbi:carboxyl transferase domain-containing protein [Nocardioides sp.]|uniref:carboxyl transferase domain-containing protein n=1 Tax=Nocardioides sp. TaxID=35761 RepID=UPI00273305A3|nr:carboxyl transferase domain-containing protein [Nocardioides sp.]MDP3894239.1 carboxyl transferase domain-containing protein [Nocardioides sp.]